MTKGEDLDGSMAALADGERGAFDEVFAALWPVCRLFARRALNDDALGDDAAQSALEKLFFQAPRYRRGTSVKAWALTLTWYEARTLLRRRSRSGETALDDAHRSDGDAADDIAVSRDLVRRALDVVDGLAARDRVAIVAALDGRPAGDDADRKRRQRALDRLRGIWRAIYE